MPARPIATRSPGTLHAALLASVSVLTLLIAGAPARAGNLLARSVPSPVSNAMAGAAVSAQQAAAMAQQSMASLAHATQAIQAMQAAQTAARNLMLAAPSTVPDGLAAGGLVPDSGLAGTGVANPVSTWTNANTPVQSSSNGQTLVTVQQTAQKAILNWTSFNIGKNTELYINQSAGNSSTGNGWVALNRVADPSGVPSQILGSIKAEGSVYVINGNGIIFGGSSQVNVSSLIVSSLNLFSNTFGDANTPGTTVYRFLNGGIGDLGPSNFATDSTLLTTNNPNAGAVTIEPGASINLTTNGLAVIAAPNVANSGMITAPSGQVALIAGIGVSYTYNYSATGQPLGTNNDASTLLVFTNSGQLTSGRSDVTPVGALVNNGLVLTPRGNITLLGGTIAQNGVAVATTSVQQSGSIVITSQYDATANTATQITPGLYTGAVTFGPQSVTAVLPDTNGVTLPSDATSLAPFTGNSTSVAPLPIQGSGTIDVIGQAIDFQGGSLTYAPGQAITASTLVLPDPRPVAPPVPAPGRILLEAGAVLDVSGIPDTELAASANLLTVTLGGNELADDPMQQNGPLYGQSVTVDMRLTGTNAETGESWVGTPLANLSSYANLEQNSIGQLLVNGGSISLGANEFVGAPGSIINLTGGYIQYLSGWVQTTRLLGDDGRIYNIGSTDPLVTYVAIVGQTTITDARWGVKNTYTASLVGGGYEEPDYIQGGNAGTLSITLSNTANGTSGNAVADSGALVVDSSVLASAAAGAQQVASGALPANATFSFQGVLPIEIGDPGVLSAQSAAAASMPANFSAATPLLATPGSPYAAANVFDSQVLDSADFDKISLTTLGPSAALVEDPGTSLTVQPGGAISLSGGNVTINGDLTARGGSISITTQPAKAATNTGVPADLMIGASAVLDVSGFFYNDFTDLFEPAAASLVNSGSIALVTNEALTASGADETGNIMLAPGSVLDLESGGHALANGTLQLDSTTGAPVGRGGNLTLETYAGLSVPPTNVTALTRGILTLDGSIDGLGFSGGGTLTLQQIAFQVGGNAATAPSHAFYFDPTHWGDLGFGSFVLNSILQTNVVGTVTLTHENLLPNFTAIADSPSGSVPADFVTAGSLTGTQLSPTNLAIQAGIEEQGNSNFAPKPPLGSDYAQVDAGAQIIADPGASISLSSYVMVVVLGSVTAHGGSITIDADYSPNSNNVPAEVGPIYLGPNSVLDVSGTTVINPLPALVKTANGLVAPVTGEVLAGGTINLTENGLADGMAILVAPGAQINVSGASGTFDVAQLPPGSLGGSREVLSQQEVLSLQPVWSNAGQVNITAPYGLLFEGTLIGNPGARQASGGTLQITSGNTPDPATGANLILVPDTIATYAAATTGSASPFANLATYMPTVTAGPSVGVPGGATLFGADSLTGSGFSSLILNSSQGIGFSGQVSLSLTNSFIANAPVFTATNAALTDGAGTITNGASLTVAAPYIEMSGGAGLPTPPSPPPATADATLTLSAGGQFDLMGFMYLANIGQANFISGGDIRLLPAAIIPQQGTQLLGYLLTTGNLTFEAANIYPATDTAFVIQATPQTSSSLPTTITFEYPAGVAPSTATPLSAGGTLLVDASNIVQDGEISAPFGSIILGLAQSGSVATALGDPTGSSNSFLYATAANTTSVTLGAGSVTSVSANGATIPYGSTVDQTTWIYNPETNNPSWANSSGTTANTAYTNPLTAAPQGIVSVTAAAITASQGSVIDLDGGGDLRAQEWIPGTGGSRNVLLQSQTSYQNSTTGQQVPTYPNPTQVIYAILPTYQGVVAPYDAALSQSGLSAGEAVTLAGGNGLPAGTYLLLPAQYATLPGAYRVVVNSGVVNPLVTATQTLPDGTMEMTGQFTNLLGGGTPSGELQFLVQPQSVWGKYSQYALASANQFFPTYAAEEGLATPYIPIDGGRLMLSATTGLTLDGTLRGAPAPGSDGIGAQVDISAQYIEVVDSGSGLAPVNGTPLSFTTPSTSGLIPAGTTVTFPVTLSASDVFTVNGTGTLVVPTGVTVEQVAAAGSKVTASGQTATLPSGDTLIATSGTTTIAVGTTDGVDRVQLASGNTVTLPVSSSTSVTIAATSNSLQYAFKSGSGANQVTISSTQEFTVGGVNVPQTSPGVFSTTTSTITINQAIKGTAAGQTITFTTGPSGGSALGAGTLTYTGTTATATLATTLSSGSSTYTLDTQGATGTAITALAASDTISGTYKLSGSVPGAGLLYSPGSYAVLTGSQFTTLTASGVSTPVTFITNAVDTIACASGSGAVSLATSNTYLQVSAQQLDALDATSLLIGGTRSFTSAGMIITPTASGVVVANDSSAPLAAPEIMLVAAPQFTTTALALDTENNTAGVSIPIAGTGQVLFNSGSMVQAQGTVAPGEPSTIYLGSTLASVPTLPTSLLVSAIQGGTTEQTLLANYYAAVDAALGTLVRVSNGSPVTVQLPSTALLDPASIAVTDNVTTTNPTFTIALPSLTGASGLTIQSGATVAGGDALTLASTGTAQVLSGASLTGNNITATSSSITFGPAGTVPPSGGMVIDPNLLTQLETAQTLDLQSSGAVSFLGDVTIAMTGTDASLTLGGGSFTSNGGNVSIAAPTLTLDNPLSAPAPGPSGGTGTLAVNTGELIFGTGATTFQGFGSVSMAATQGMVGQGTGSFNFGALPLTLQTPLLIAGTGSTQTLTTTGALSVVPVAGGTAMSSTALGGAITLQGGSVTVSVPLLAAAGNITLTASSGSVEVTGTETGSPGIGSLTAHGIAQTLDGITEYADAGNITLSANQGTVIVDSGATVDFAGAAVGGNGGTLSIITSNSTASVELNGTLKGGTANGYKGSGFSLNTSGAVDLDPLAQLLTTAGVTGEIIVQSGQGDLSLSQTLTASTVGLIANNGSVIVSGTINASGAAGGTIELFGTGTTGTVTDTSNKTYTTITGGVTVTGSLLAEGSSPTQLGGTVEIGTTGLPSGMYNATYGYETVNAPQTITTSAGQQTIYSSGAITIGSKAAINVSGGTFDGLTGGTILIRAPLLADGSANVTLSPGAAFTGSRATTLEAYAVWSTADKNQTNLNEYFDGVIDPAGWYSATGTLLAGTFTNASGATVATWNGSTTSPNLSAAQLAADLTNDYFAPNSPNTAHETFYGYNTTTGGPGTLMGFVEAPGFQTVANSSGIANFSEAPGIELDNPISANVNNGNITVATNWNLGAINANFVPVFRYHNTIAPILTLRAGGNVAVNASLTDGFESIGLTLPAGAVNYSTALADYNFDAPFSTFSDLQGVEAPLSPLPSDALQAPDTPSVLGLSGASPYDGYYAAYLSYVNEYQNAFINNDVFGANGFATVSKGGVVAPSSVTSLLATAQSLYSTTNLNSYASYIAAYDNYSVAYSNWVANIPITHANPNGAAATVPVAPEPPPNLSAPVAPTPATTANDGPAPVATAAIVAPITSMNLANEASSSSYRIVAGALFGSANPLAVQADGSGNVSLNDHTAFPLTITNPSTSVSTTLDDVSPTTIRTGTGDIAIAAAGNFQLLDQAAPGVIYTAGTANEAPSPVVGLSVATDNSGSSPRTLLTASSNPTEAGTISINVQGNIIGLENAVDITGAETGAKGAFVGQFWTPWLLTDPTNPSVAWYVNFGSFDQGIVSIGGNVNITAGGNISDLAVSLATTGYLDASNTLHVTGGGNLTVSAGGNILSGDYYVGQGSGTITSGGAIAPDFNYYVAANGSLGSYAVPVATMLAVQYGTIGVEARQSINIGSVVDPTYLWGPSMYTPLGNGNGSGLPVVSSSGADLVPFFTSMSANSGVSIQANSGSLTFNSLLVQAALLSYGASLGDTVSNQIAPQLAVSSLLLPASLNLVALDSGIDIEYGGGLYPSAAGTLSIIADQSINLGVPVLTTTKSGVALSSTVNFAIGSNLSGYTLEKLDYPVGTGILPTAADPALVPVGSLPATLTNDASLITATASAPVEVVAATGSIIDGVQTTAGDGRIYLANVSGNVPLAIAPGGNVDQISLIANAPAEICAGLDILDLPFYGTNFTPADVTSIIAGRDIRYDIFGDAQSPAIELAGPGTLDVIAGRNLSFESQRVSGASETGIRTLGNAVDPSTVPIFDDTQTLFTGNDPTITVSGFGNPYLPVGGAAVNLLFGVGPGMASQAFAAQYVNPAAANAALFGASADLINFVTQYENGSGTPISGSLTAAQAWAIFETLPADQQQLLVEQVFFDILNTTGLDYNNPDSPSCKQYSAGYQAINTLFPAAYGYTANALGTVNGANQEVDTGTLDMRGSTIQTQQGGNISVLGPGGRILVGSADAAPAVNPANYGILTLEKGNIDIFADQDVLVAQSRIMTEQGGDILMWSSNGNLDAGKGAKTSVSAPPPKFDCDIDYRCSADIKGQVSGAGIATLQSLPGVPAGNANLIAPRGTVNAGAAGIRVSGNLNIAALIVANTFNIQVQGTTTGIPTAVAPNIGSLTSASNAAGQAAAAATDAARHARSGPPPQELPSIITVEVIGYGGGGNEPPQPQDQQRKKRNDRDHRNDQSYDPSSMFRIIGNGALSEEEKSKLTKEERSRL